MTPHKPSPLIRLAVWGASAFFRRFQRSRLHPPTPDWPGCVALEGISRDGCRIRGWWQPEGSGLGTILFIHGITIHSFHYVEQAQYLQRATGLSVAAMDLRFHGLSEDYALSFGLAESWDVRAFLDALEQAGARRPFILIGDSLGGLAAQRATVEDDRIDGAMLMQTPGWAWNAIRRSSGPLLAPISVFLNGHFASHTPNILHDGDLRRFRAPWIHRPPVFYVMGDRDHFDWQATREIYDWWGTENGGKLGETPLDAPRRSRWFALVEGAVHDTGLPGCYNVWRWPLIWPNLIRFIEMIVERHGQGFHLPRRPPYG